MDGSLCRGLYLFLVLFQGLIETKHFSCERFFYCNCNLIYPIFFWWLLQFSPSPSIEISERQTLDAIIHVCLCFRTFLGILGITASRYSMCQLSGKVDNLKSASRGLRSEFQKTNVAIRINILEILYVPVFWQNGQL